VAKELPYFRFTVAEWLQGDISMEKYNIKGVFIDVCAYYWFKNCIITKQLLIKRFPNASEEIKQLISLQIIKEKENDLLEINFLNEQYKLLVGISNKRSKAGKIGGLRRVVNVKQMPKQMPKQSLSYKDNNKDNNKDKYNNNIVVDRIYKLYPTKDSNNKNRVIQKTSKDKDRIKKIVKSHYPLYKAIKFYLHSCNKSRTYLKNLSVFLNNLPDVDLVNEVKLSDLKIIDKDKNFWEVDNG